MMIPNLFKHRDVLRIYPDLRPRTLISWVDKGLLSPEVKASGTGTRNQYSVKNLVEIGVIRELITYRIPQSVVESIMRQLANEASLLTEENDFDVVVVYSRGYVSGYKSAVAYTGHVRVGSRSRFAEKANFLIFGEESLPDWGSTYIPESSSAIVISLRDIWEYIRNRL